MSALGVHAVGWKAPTEAELAHDYLWRIHQQVPQAGDITVFNRSHYEDVLVPVVNGWITPEQHQPVLQRRNGDRLALPLLRGLRRHRHGCALAVPRGRARWR